MDKKLHQQPWFVGLLPVFFVVHGILENIGFIGLADAAALCFTYLLATAALLALFYWFFRSFSKASLMTACCLAVYFGFGTLHDFLHDHSPVKWLSRYGFLLPALFALLVFIGWRLKETTRPLHRLTGFLNLLLAVYLLVDIGWIGVKTLRHDQQQLSTYTFEQKDTYLLCDTCDRPDIYFLLFDEYASSASLQERYQFNNDLDTFLVQKGFSLQAQSRSNYNFTPFSIASILNMAYLQGIPNPQSVTAEDYARCNELIRHNQVIRLLDIQGYDLINYSPFELAGHPSPINQSFLPLKTRLITGKTLFARVNRDLGWWLAKRLPFSLFATNDILKERHNNNRFIELTKQSAAEKRSSPAFIYTHFFMPHVPFYYDKAGRERSIDQLYQEAQKGATPLPYLDYVTYTNTRIREMVNAIQQQNPAAVIIIMGDHGFRGDSLPPASPHFFANYNAVYLPGKGRTGKTAPTGVNQFRVLFNELFHQSLPLLKDSCIFLQDQVKRDGL